jgi:hypothetical protein
MASSERLASGGDHISTDSDGRLCIDDSPTATITSACTPLRKGPHPRLPTGGDNEAIKAKEPEVRRHMALTVSPAETTTSVVGSLTSGGDHLSTDDSGHLRTSAVPVNGGHPSAREEVLAPVLTVGVRTRPSKNATAAPMAYDVLYDPPVRPATRVKPWVWPTCARRDHRPCGGRTATPRPSGGRQRRRRHQSHLGRGARHAVADDALDDQPRVAEVRLLRKAGERPSPPNAGGRSGSPAHAKGGAPTRLALLPSADDEHP